MVITQMSSRQATKNSFFISEVFKVFVVDKCVIAIYSYFIFIPKRVVVEATVHTIR